MAKPNNTIRGFIEVPGQKGQVLLALHNIIGIGNQGGKAVITLNIKVDTFYEFGTTTSVNLSYETVLDLVREAAL